MRQALFVKGIIAPDLLEDEVERKAIATQRAEGLTDPIIQETEELWHERLNLIRDYLTDFYFAYNIPYSQLKEIIEQSVNENRTDAPVEVFLTFNPELAPWYVLFKQAEKFATAPPEQFKEVQHYLREIIVVLLKGQVSDQLAFIRIARKFITIFDLKRIKDHKVGRGKIGGKAAGMILAHKILTQPKETDEIELAEYLEIPETYFVGGDVYYNFTTINKLEYSTSQKYRTREEIEQEYPTLRKEYLAGRFPDDVVEKLRQFLENTGKSPLIVRSSSLLEDNFGSAFAGKYDSFFLPNQGTEKENLTALVQAIIKVYASVLSPDALFYRQIQGLDDYDERMGILIQKVQGEQHGQYFFPYIAGVGFSQNPFIWNNKLKRDEGFLRIVMGLGTRAVDRVDKDYPRMIGLSHPMLRPVKGAAAIKKYSQRYMDVINLETNQLETIPIKDILSIDFPGIQYLASIDEGDFIKPIYSLGKQISPETFVITFDNLLQNTDFVRLMKIILKKLEQHYKCPVDIEFAIRLIPGYPKPDFKIFLLQCRPLSNQKWEQNIIVPTNINPADKIFSANYLVPQGIVERIKYIIYVDPVAYNQIPSDSIRLELARIIGRLNKQLADENFILMGPGRWGSSNLRLGVKVTYADIYNTKMLVEIAITQNGAIPEVSYGTHFFQDLVESQIYPLALYPDDHDNIFNHQFLEKSKNQLSALLPGDSAYAKYIKVVNIDHTHPNKRLKVVMNAEQSNALGYLYQC